MGSKHHFSASRHLPRALGIISSLSYRLLFASSLVFAQLYDRTSHKVYSEADAVMVEETDLYSFRDVYKGTWRKAIWEAFER